MGKLILGMSISVLLLIIAVAGAVALYSVNEVQTSGKYKVTCDIEVRNWPLMDTSFAGTPVCYTEQASNCLSLSLFGLKDQGQIKMVVGSKAAYEDYSVWENDKVSTSMSVDCVDASSTKVDLYLYNDKGEPLDSTRINLNMEDSQ